MAISNISNQKDSNSDVLNFFKDINSSKKQKNFANLLNNTNNSQNKNQNNNKIDKNDPASKIILTKKGQVGYVQAMDTDNDGQISLAELNAYCEENGVSEKEKLALITAMQSSKLNSKLVKENVKNDDEEETKETETAEDKNAYATKGDDKYNEEMDYNKNGVVSYAEYLKYKSEHGETTDDTSTEPDEKTQNSTENSESFELPTQKDVENINTEVETTDTTVEFDA